MSVTAIAQYRPGPGGPEKARELYAEGKSLLLKNGANAVHFRRFVAGGEFAGIQQVMVDYDSMEAWGEASAKLNADADFQDLLGRVNAPGSPLQFIGLLITQEVATFGDATPGPAALVRLWDVQPGRLDEFLSLVEEVMKVSAGAGLGVAVRRLTIAGESSGRLVTAGSMGSMAALGAYMDSLDTNPELQRIQAQALGPDGPAKLLGMAISAAIEV